MELLTNFDVCQRFDVQIASDLHKDAFGYRPRSQWSEWASMTPAELDSEWDSLLQAHDDSMAQEALWEAQAIAEFEAGVAAARKASGCDYATAVRWMRDAFEGETDQGYFEYSHGLPYGYLSNYWEGR